MTRLLAVVLVVFILACVVAWVAYLLTPESNRPSVNPILRMVVYVGVLLGLVGVVAGFVAAVWLTLINFGIAA